MPHLRDMPAEALRLSELQRYDIVIDRPEPAFDELAALAARLLEAPLAGISLVDDAHVWLKGRHGVELECLAREGAFCSYAVESHLELFEVPDASRDPRFEANALVAQAPNVRCYMAATLTGQRGYVLGTLWFMDLVPRTLTLREREILLGLAAQAVRLLELRYRATETGLPSRNAFTSNLQCALNQGSGGSQACRIADCSRRNSSGRCISQGLSKAVTVGYIHLRNVHLVHSTFGRERGAQLLQKFAAMLSAWRSPRDMLAQVDGEHFAFALFADAGSGEDRLSRLESLLARPVSADSDLVFFSCSVGVAHSDALGGNASALLDQAATAATQATDVAMTSVHVYEPRHRDVSLAWVEFQRQIADNIRQRRLVPHYQAQVDVITGRIVGFEALARMRHPELGVVGPDAFLSVAGHAGLMRLLDMQMLEAVFRDLATWRNRGLPAVPVAVNLSRATLMHTKTIESIITLLAEFEVPAELIAIEITESGLSEAPETLKQRAQELSRAGVAVALDDFGTGMSNLDALRSLHFDCLKADRLYVHGASVNAHIGAILRFIHGIAELFGARLVCEGVEELSDLRWAMGLGCRYFQGWYFCRDTDADGVSRLLESLMDPAWVAPAGDVAALARFLQTTSARPGSVA